jgi:hypothetical protein
MKEKTTPDPAHISLPLLPRNRSGALEISFGWLFAIIAGIVIIFIAIYLSSKLINSGQGTINAETGKEIGILLNPLETSFESESAQTTSITIPSETRIDAKCDDTGNFGRQIIQLEQESFGKWTNTDVNVFFNNKYIFAENGVEGKDFHIFSKQFNFPFKIADLIYITSSNDNYCFVDASDKINQEIFSLNQSNLFIGNCPNRSIRVCFDSENCNISVDLNSGTVQKNGKAMYFSQTDFSQDEEGTSPLMYAAIFSEKDVYECQVKRLMMRLKELSLLYANKETLLQKEGCDNNLGGDLNQMGADAESLSSSEEIGIIKMDADIVDEKNNARGCPLW